MEMRRPIYTFGTVLFLLELEEIWEKSIYRYLLYIEKQ
jgi:hypothetical protein